MVLAILLTTFAWAQGAEPLPFTPGTEEALKAGLEDIRSAKHAPAVSMAVVHRGRIVFAQALGLADTEKRLSATPATRFRIGAVSRIFTAVAVMQLVERKRIDLDVPYGDYLPWGPHAREVTVRQLLTHRSGIPDYLQQALADNSVAGSTTPPAIVRQVAGRPLHFPPGTAYGHSNTNYVLLGLIVEKVAAEPLGTYVADHVFAPAGMRDTTFGDPPAGTPVCVGYAMAGPPGPAPGDAPCAAMLTQVASGDPSWFYACGSVVSTASDVAAFDLALMDGALLKPATFRQMIDATRPTREPGGGGHGLGLQVLSLGDRRLVGHRGGRPGFESENEMIPADRFAVVVLGNSGSFPTGLGLQLALGTFYPSVVRSLRTRSGTSSPSPKEW